MICQEKEITNDKFTCDLCCYSSTSRKSLNIHKGAKHKAEIASKSKTTSYGSFKPPIPCIKSEDGCQITLTSYFSSYTAICLDCENLMAEKLKSSPFPSIICQCCYQHPSVPPYLLCQVCTDIKNNG